MLPETPVARKSPSAISESRHVVHGDSACGCYPAVARFVSAPFPPPPPTGASVFVAVMASTRVQLRTPERVYSGRRSSVPSSLTSPSLSRRHGTRPRGRGARGGDSENGEDRSQHGNLSPLELPIIGYTGPCDRRRGTRRRLASHSYYRSLGRRS